MNRLLVCLLLLLPSVAVAQDEATVSAVVELQTLYGANLMGGGAQPDLDARLAASGASPAVAAFFGAGLRGAPVLAPEHLALPDRETLEVIYAVDAVHQTSRDEPRPDPASVAREALVREHDVHLLAHNYYGMLFTFVGNKVRPFDLSGYDFDPLSYTGGDAELAAIFYLEAMEMSQKHIWGLLNIAQPPNYSGAAEMIAGYPRFNGQPYYAFKGLDPGEFEAHLDGETRPYRAHYVNELYKTLLYHLRVIMEAGGTRDEAVNLIKRSAISRPEYHRYFESPEVLASLLAQAGQSN